MSKENYFFNAFSLAFIEELTQGGISFHFPKDENFIEAEFPHYQDDFVAEMKWLYKQWKHYPEEFSSVRRHLISVLGREVSEKIGADASFRFILLKNFHDSIIVALFYDQERRTLILKMDYDDAFSKISFGTDLTLKFRGVANCRFDIVGDLKNMDNSNLLIEYVGHSVEGGKVSLLFEGMDVNQGWKEWSMLFTYEQLEICGSNDK